MHYVQVLFDTIYIVEMEIVCFAGAVKVGLS